MEMVKFCLVIIQVILGTLKLSNATLYKKMTLKPEHLNVSVFNNLTVDSKIQCAFLCQLEGASCQVFLYNKITGSCKLVNISEQSQPVEPISQDDLAYFDYGKLGFKSKSKFEHFTRFSYAKDVNTVNLNFL